MSYFAVDWQTLRVQCDKPELRICVVIKKKLNFFEYKRGEFTPYKVYVCFHGPRLIIGQLSLHCGMRVNAIDNWWAEQGWSC